MGGPPVGAGGESKRANEIGAVVPMLEAIGAGLAGKTRTADAPLTRTSLADFLIDHGAHHLFAVKGNRPSLPADLDTHFQKRGEPDFQEEIQLRHGRMERRAIRTTTALNGRQFSFWLFCWDLG